MGHEYAVEFRIYGDDLDPDAVTAVLGMKPCRTVSKGTIRADGQSMQSLWAFDGDPERPFQASLEEALSFVLDKLLPVHTQLLAYKDCAHLIWWCGHFQSAFDGGYTLSAAILKKLADFGVEIFVDNYFTSLELSTSREA